MTDPAAPAPMITVRMKDGTTNEKGQEIAVSCPSRGAPCSALLADIDDGLDRRGALLEHALLFVRERDLDDLLDALAANDARDAHEEVGVAELAFEVGRAGKELS